MAPPAHLTAAVIRALQRDPPPGLRALTRRSDLRGLLALAGDLAAIAGLVALDLAIDAWWLTTIVIWLIGHRHWAIIEGLCHQAAHRTLFRSRRLHRALAWLYAWPFAVDVERYRAEHMAHHRDFLGPGDHTCAEYRALGLGPDDDPDLRWAILIRPFLGYATLTLGAGYLHQSRRVQLTWIVMSGLAVVSGLWLPFLLYHVIPRFYVAAIYIYWSDITDHYRAPSGVRNDASWLANLLSHNEGLHSVHHVHPAVPWFNMRRAHELCPHPHDECRGVLAAYREMRRWRGPGAFPTCF
ncbi:MAG: fatty acid desaturase [Myxococcales bacterium]|nr:fatty acid desaturase [Myxococcales bacterium]